MIRRFVAFCFLVAVSANTAEMPEEVMAPA